MADKREKLFDQFPAVPREEWMAKVTADLKGADFQKRLVWRTNEGFNVQPMYMAEDIKDLKTTSSLPGEYPFIRGTRTKNDWAICQEVIVYNLKDANNRANEILGKGITSISFIVNVDKVDFNVLLSNIDITKVQINLTSTKGNEVALAKDLVSYVKAQKAEKTFVGTVNFDPYKETLNKGTEVSKEVVATALELLKAVEDLKNLRIFAVETYILNNAGAYIAQELSYALAWGSQWMTMLTEAGVAPEVVASRIFFAMGISSNYFMEIAKFRAARMLWAQIVKAYNPKDEDCCKMFVQATTSEFNQTIFDAYVNLLRSQTEAMSAALAGVDAIIVTPFDKQYKNPDEFSEHLARNQQLLLKEESHLDKVIDPAGGSYYVETLTLSIANEAWKEFLAIEDNNGFEAMVKEGKIQEAVNASAEKRHTDVARRKEVLLGSNQFPNFNEIAHDKIELNREKDQLLNTKRAASQFEELRLETEKSGKRPKVFMLTIGNLAMRLARSQFSANFFACAGYQIIDNLGFETVKEGIDAALAKEAEIVVLCSSDDEYATFAPEAYKELNGRAEFVVAGAPACMEDLQKQGITEFIHVRSNVLETLKAFNAKLLK